MEIPKFQLYGENDPRIEEDIQPRLDFRQWSDLTTDERRIALLELRNSGWLGDYSKNIFRTINYLNHHFLKQCPGKNLHQIQPKVGYDNSNESQMTRAALEDFQQIFSLPHKLAQLLN